MLLIFVLSSAESSPYTYFVAPSDIVLNSTVIRENRDPGGGGIGVGDFVDDEGNAIDYELVTGEGSDDNAAFRIVKKANNSQLQAVQEFDFEDKSAYSIRVRATLNGSIEKIFTIEVTNEEEPPTDILISNNLVDQDANEGDDVGIFSVVGGAPVQISYNLLDDADEAFELDGNTLKIGDEFDDEDQTSYTIEVEAVGDGAVNKTFTITVNESDNQLPTANAGSDQTITLESGNETATVTLNGSASSDEDGTIESYVWSWDGGSATGETPTIELPVGLTTITLTVTDDQNSTDTDEVVITVNEATNQPPVANAGLDQTVEDTDGNGTETITLDGSGSTDDIGIVSYEWSENNTIVASGLSPNVDLTVGVHTITLTVSDAQGEADSDDVQITVNEPANEPPNADAGPDQTVTLEIGNETATITLDGSASSDADGTIVSYDWSWANGGSASGEKPTVELPVGETIITLTVEDNDGETATDEVEITVNELANQVPVAEAGEDQTILDEDRDGSELITLDGSGSFDPDGTITSYVWKENNANGNTLAQGEEPMISMPVGDNLVALVVEDDDGATASDAVMIYVDSPPLANAGPDQTITVENGSETAMVTLDGSESSDADGTIESYDWSWANGGSASGENPTVELPVGTHLITLEVTDNEGIKHGDDTSVVVNAEEAPDGINLSNSSVSENQPVGTKVGDLDVDARFVTYSLPAGRADNQFFALANDNDLVTNTVFDFESKSSYEVLVEAQYGIFRNTVEETFIITIENVTEPPADFDLSSATIEENQPVGTAVGDFTLTGANISYSLVGGRGSANNNLFTITKQGEISTLQSNAIFDFENGTSYSIRVRADNGDGTLDKEFEISILDVDENQAPTANAGEDQTLTDEDGNGTEVVTLDGSASSDDSGITSYTWSWPGGSAEGEKPDVTLPVGETIITLTVEDEDGETATDEVKITINEQPNQTPTADAGLDQTLTDENGDGKVSVTLDGSASSDTDGTIESYDWSWANGGSASGEKPTVELGIGQTTITLTVTDNEGGTDTDEVKILINAPEAPVIALTNAEVLENQEENTVVGQLESESPIALSYSLPNNTADNSFFKINEGNTLVTDAVFDREAKDSYTIEVLASYPAGSTDQEFTITILNEVEKPTDLTLSSTTVAENQAGATVGDLQTEGGQGPYTYTLTGSNNDNNLFTIENGQLKTKVALDFEDDNSLVVEITSANDGSITKKFTIEVTNVAEPPTDITLSSTSVNENEPKNTLVGEFAIEGGSVVNPSLQFADGNNDNELFKLDGKKLRTDAVFDREEKSSYKVRIRAVGDGSFAKDFTIRIANVNDAPRISVDEDQILFAEGDDPVNILSNITVRDVDNSSMSSATLTISRNYVRGEDELMTDADHQWNDSQGKLTINGPISLSDLQSALRDVRYENKKTINPTSSVREIRVVVNDGALNSNIERVSVLVDNPNVPPSLTDFEQEVSEDQVLTFNAEDFEANYEDADSDFPNKIYIASVPAEGVLTVDGEIITSELILDRRPEEGFLVDFSTVDSFTYTPVEDFNGSDKFRWNINDGSSYGNEAEVLIDVIPVNDAPTINVPSQLSAQENQPLELTSIELADIDNDMLSLTLAVSDGFLVIDPEVASSVSVLNEEDGGAKRIQASGTGTELTALLQGITYVTNSNPTGSDELRIILSDSPDNTQGAFAAETTVPILTSPTNDPPILSAIEENPIIYEENSDPTPFTQTLEITDEEQDAIVRATITMINAEEGDALTFTNMDGIQSSNNGDTLLLTGESSVEAYQTAIRTVQFVSTSDNPSAVGRLIEIQVTDANQGISNTLSRPLTISAVDDTTEIAQIAEEAFYILGSEEVSLFSDGLIIDPDDETLSSLVLQFEDGSYVPALDSLAIPIESELLVEWNEESGTLTIAGEASLEEYQNLLQSILYRYEGTEEAEKTVSVVATNNQGVISQVSQRIRIVFNQPPQITDITLDLASGQVRMFSADDFLSAYSDPDNFPTAEGFAAIRIVSLPVAGQLKLGQEVIGEDQLGDTGLLIAREDIPSLSYVMPNNEITTDQFTWNATDGAEFAEQNAVVAITIQLLSVSLNSDSDEVCRGLSLNLTAVSEGGVAPFIYEWTCDQANCGIVGNSEQIEITPAESSNYKVIVTDVNGIQTSETIAITVSACDLVIPTGFTPNGDNINDTWELQNINTFEQKLVEVYNRYGRRVFFSDTYNTAWDGTHNGKALPAGTYYYRIEVGEEAKRYQGQVTILQ